MTMHWRTREFDTAEQCDKKADKPLSRKSIIARLKELGVKIPFGASNETLAKMLEGHQGGE